MFSGGFYTIRARVVGIIMLASSITAFIVFFGAVYFGFKASEQLLKNQIKGISQIIAENSIAAVGFDDHIATQANLTPLENIRSVTYAEIKNAHGKLMAVYHPPKQQLDGVFGLLSEPFPTRAEINSGGTFIGHVHILADRSSILPAVKTYVILAFLILIVSLFITYAVARRLQASVSEPIDQLNQSMERVIAYDSKRLVLENNRSDEIGALIQNFNDMLKIMDERDRILQLKADELRNLISTQDSQLSEEEAKRIDWLQNLARFLQHELKNTLLGFRTSLDLIEIKQREGDVSKYIDRARQSIIFMSKLLHNVGQTSSLEASLLDEKTEIVELKQLTTNWLNRHMQITGNTAFELTTDTAIYIKANTHRIEQLLEKLVANAETYSLAETNIQLTLHAANNEVILSVANQGAPLPEDKNRIFELFVSLRDETHNQQSAGHTGLGLYVVKIIAEAYSGYVVAKDMNNASGAVFEVRFPQLHMETH